MRNSHDLQLPIDNLRYNGTIQIKSIEVSHYRLCCYGTNLLFSVLDNRKKVKHALFSRFFSIFVVG